MLTCVHLVSAGLEIGGIAFVVKDIGKSRKYAKDILVEPLKIHVRAEPTRQLRIYQDDHHDRRAYAQEHKDVQRKITAAVHRADHAERQLRKELGAIYDVSWRQLFGPVLVVLGIIVGTCANIRRILSADRHE